MKKRGEIISLDEMWTYENISRIGKWGYKMFI